MSTEQRPSGYHWIKTIYSEGWSLAWWDEYQNGWFLVGKIDPYKLSQISEIDPTPIKRKENE